MQVNVSFEMSVDEEQFNGTHDWCASRIEGAIEETMRAAVGFAVPFARQGIAVSVGNFKFERSPAKGRPAREKRPAKPDCRCSGPDYHPDKPCPVHPKVPA